MFSVIKANRSLNTDFKQKEMSLFTTPKPKKSSQSKRKEKANTSTDDESVSNPPKRSKK